MHEAAAHAEPDEREVRAGHRTLDGGRVTPAPLLEPGRLIAGRYELGQRIGEGGNGAVYRGRHVGLDLPLAIKVIPPLVTLMDGEGTPSAPLRAELLTRFVREARTAARVRHRNVLHIHDAGQLEDGSPYLVTELIEGSDLEQWLRKGPLSIAALVDLGRQVFSALSAIAAAGIVHRDIKPANLMLRREADGHVHVTLIDFGIARDRVDEARLTVTGAILGTPHYMAPEQLRGETLDARADLYAACTVLYEALTGRAPFDGESTPVVIGKILAADFVPIAEARPGCPEALAALIERGLGRDRTRRPSGPLEVCAELERIAYHEGLETGALAWAEPNMQPLTGRLLDRPPTNADPAETWSASQQAVTTPAVAPARRRWARRAVITGIAAAALSFVPLSADRPRMREVVEESLAPAVAEALAPVAAPMAVPAAEAPRAAAERHLEAGLAALARGEMELALENYRAAVALDDTLPQAHRGRGLAAARAGLDDEAIRSLERYLSLSPDAPDADRIRARARTLREHRRTSTSPR
jgi:eukaryotic-like serine/threonine-protein kinase